jgi:DnaJ-domain-containing protein 1
MTTHRTCAHPDCSDEGLYPAPRDPRNLSARQYYCLRHIKEINAKWNGLSGLSEEEIVALQHGAATWNRPTKPFGLNSTSFRAATFDPDKAKDYYNLFTRIARDSAIPSGPALPPDVQQACAVFTLSPPLTPEKVKERYRHLAKKYHPDVNRGDTKAEDRIKQINGAYQVLLRYLAKDAG